MKIIHLIPGSGGTFYCQNCMRDATLVQRLHQSGHDVLMTPMYLPLFSDGAESAGDTPVFFGGINVWLQQQFGLFRKTPRWLDRLFDAEWMLRLAAKREGATSAADLGEMTLSMLQGRAGRQRKEVDRLIAWLRNHDRPDIIHVSNALLLGVAVEIKRALDVPVVCSLQDEDTWMEAMKAPWGQRCWDAIAELAKETDAFAAVSEWYAEKMRRILNLPLEKTAIIPPGIEVSETEPPLPSFDPPAIGFLSRMAEGQGLGLLVDAYLNLRKDPAFANLRLLATGGITPGNENFIRDLRRRIEKAGAENDVLFLPEFDKAHRRDFLRSISVMSVPMVQGEAFGTFIIEAWAQGVPVVQPRAGGYAELVEKSGGGLLFDPADLQGLESALRDLLYNPEKARTMGARGRVALLENYTIDIMAEKTLALYRDMVTC
jgi:glycosyltransferase involved in cell wall biosynthesis